MKKKKLGEVLHERGQISQSNLAQAVSDQQGKIILLGELLLERELISKAQLVSALEEVTHIPYVDCGTVSPDPDLLRKISPHIARKCLALPIAVQNSAIVVVMAEPQNLELLDEIKFTVGRNVSPRFGFREEILEAIAKHYGDSVEATPPSSGPKVVVGESGSSTEMEFITTSSRKATQEAIQEAQSELLRKVTPAVKIVSEVIMAAIDKRASDIHIQPQAKEVIIRVRVDGVLQDLRRIPREIQNTLISRIKILADMDIAERRIPQDGGLMVRVGTASLDMRVSTLPTQYGEKVVMRLLSASSSLRNLSELSMPVETERSLRQVLALPQGMLLVTGPTGSGKSTTLYAVLNLLRKPAVNIVTVEDPVEYVLAGVNQVHVNNKAGLTFASCLRSILRQDPNVIMIGEIRDKETAEIALKAAQTGHLLLSTLHTNDSLSAVTRLLDLGIPGFMIASSVTAIVAQRLVRRLCVCRREVPATAEAREHLSAMSIVQPLESISIPTGCPVCNQTGYRGRVGVYEILLFDDAIREAISNGESGETIRAILHGMGMKLMQEDALDKIRLGITSVEEVARVVPVQALHSAQCPACAQKIARTYSFCPHCGARQIEPNSSTSGRSLNVPSEESVAL